MFKRKRLSPGSAPPPEREAEILASTLRVFAREGCFRTTVGTVTADLGVGRSTLYRAFPSQAELLGGAIRTAREGLARHARPAKDSDERGEDAMRQLVGVLVDASLARRADSPDTLSRLSCCTAWMSPARDLAPGGADALAGLVREWQGAGLLDKDHDAAWVSTVILALTSSPLMLAGPTGLDRAALVEEITRVVGAAFRTTGANLDA